MKNTFVAIFYTVIVSIAVIEILVLGYLSSFHLFVWAGVTIGTAYGLFVNGHLVMQMILATQNRWYINKLRSRARYRKFAPTVDIIATGFKENPNLLRQHYESILTLRQPFQRYWFTSDGNCRDDQYSMVQIFREVFPEGIVVEFPFILKNTKSRWDKQQWRETIKNIPADAKYIYIAQPHEDKRRAMYTTIRSMFLLGKPEIIINTDSDTKFKSNVIREMCAPFIEPQVGAVTGDVRILNRTKKTGGSWLSFLSSLRYWQAFNLERAAQSFFGVVYCVSGPLGAYRTKVWEEILEDWANQTLMGRRTTTGEDRCSTNYTLRSKGKGRGEAWRVHYTPFTYCETETPTQLWRWIKQQERWSRSFYREAALNYLWAHKHHTWLTYELAYHMIFPFLLIVSVWMQVALVLETGNLYGLGIFVLTIFVSGLLRSLYGFFYTRQKQHFFLAFYGFLYMTFLLWAKLFALLFVWRTGWGTSTRQHMAYLPSSNKNIAN